MTVNPWASVLEEFEEIRNMKVVREANNRYLAEALEELKKQINEAGKRWEFDRTHALCGCCHRRFEIPTAEVLETAPVRETYCLPCSDMRCDSEPGQHPKEPHCCHFCGTLVLLGYQFNDGDSTGVDRHWLSDCRPDLAEHQPGELCTWSHEKDNPQNCYAYQDRDTRKWGTEHKHFYNDGPM